MDSLLKNENINISQRNESYKMNLMEIIELRNTITEILNIHWMTSLIKMTEDRSVNLKTDQ